MFLGVPLTILVPVALGFIIVFILTNNTLVLLALAPVVALLRLLARQDDFIFDLMLLQTRFRTSKRSDALNGGVKSFAAISYDKSNNYSDLPSLSVVDLSEERSFEEFIPYSSLLNDTTVFTKDYRFMTTFEVKGIAFETEDDIRIQSNQEKINGIIKSLNNQSISFYVHSVRRKTSDHMPYRYDSAYLENFAAAYYDTFKKEALYENIYYITMIYSPFSTGVIDSRAFANAKRSEKARLIKKHIELLDEHVSRFKATLSAFGIQQLSTYTHDGMEFSRQLEFYSFLLSGKKIRVAVQDAPLNKYLTGGLQRLYFNKASAALKSVDGSSRFVKIIEIKEYSNTTHAGMLNALMYLDVEYTITQSFTPLHNTDAKSMIKRKRNQLIQAQDDGLTQISEIEVALDDLTSGDVVLGKYYFEIAIYADSKEEVVDKTSDVIAALDSAGIQGIVADRALPSSYFAQLPANFRLRPRVHTITSYNFADLVSLHNVPKGKRTGNCWGDAIMPMRTPTKQSYYLNIHKTLPNENSFGKFYLANFLVFGESGGGKTAFLMLLLNMLVKYNDARTFPKDTPDHLKKATYIFLDKDKGAMGNILALGGKYIEVETGVATGFNPFMCDYTDENISNLKSLVKLMIASSGSEKLTTVEEESMTHAIKTILKFDKEDRKYPITLLTQLVQEDLGDHDSLRKRLSLWTKGNVYGWAFDNESDNFSFSDQYKVFGIDGTEILKEKETKDPLCFYIFWRIMEMVDGRRFGLIGDEAHAWLENEIVRKFVYNKEKTIRKENGFLGFATQSIEDIVQNQIARTMIEQSESIFFFPNPQGRENDYVNHLTCSKKEFETIIGFRPDQYHFYLKRSNEKLVIDADLSRMPGYFLKILSTSLTYVDEIKDIFAREDLTHDQKVERLIQFYKGGKE